MSSVTDMSFMFAVRILARLLLLCCLPVFLYPLDVSTLTGHGHSSLDVL